MMNWLNNDYGGWGGNMMGWFGGGIMMVVFWILIIAFIFWIVREVGGKNSNSKSSPNALEILKERYAKSEISKEEFEEKMKDLG